MSKRKPYDRINAVELAGATKKYDAEFAADHREAKPRTAADRAKHAAGRRLGRPRVGKGAAKVYISIEKGLLSKAEAYAKRTGISRSELIARSVRATVGA